MGQVSGMCRKVVSVLGGGVVMAAVAVAAVALPASGTPDRGPSPGERRLTLVPLTADGDGRLAAALERADRSGRWMPVGGEVVTFAFVGEGSLRFTADRGPGRCSTAADGRCLVSVRGAGSEPSLLLATTRDLSAEVTVPRA